MLSHVDKIKTNAQGLGLETGKLKESQGHQVLEILHVKRNLDQDHGRETIRLRKGQGHIPRKDAVKKVCQSHDHVLIHTVVDPGLDHLGSPGLDHVSGPGLGHLDVENHVLDHVGNHLHLGIFEGFPLVGKEVWAHSEDAGQDHAPGLVDPVQEEGALQGRGSRDQDLEEEGHVQAQDHDYKVGGLGHVAGDHVPHPEIEDKRDQDQNPAHTQETEEEAGAKADLSQNQTRKRSLATLYQLLV